jgi:hypothetical protein
MKVIDAEALVLDLVIPVGTGRRGWGGRNRTDTNAE